MLLGTQRVNDAGHLEIGGCDTVDLARRFGTPLYVMDETLVRENCRRYKAAFAARYPGESEVSYDVASRRVRGECMKGTGRVIAVGVVAVTLLASLLFGCARTSKAPPGRTDPLIGWLDSYAEAVSRARTANKPILLVLLADSGEAKSKLETDTFTDYSIVRLMDDFVPLKVGAESPEGKRVVAVHNVQDFPATLVLTPWREEIMRLTGYTAPALLAERMRKALEAHPTVSELEAQVKGDPNDREATYQLVSIYAERTDEKAALAALAKLERANPENVDNLRFLGLIDVVRMCLMRADNPGASAGKKAEPLLRRAIAVGKRQVDRDFARFTLGLAYMAQGDIRSARQQYETIIKTPNVDTGLKEQAQSVLDGMRKRGQL